jgi:transcriptional regulator with XRE-family HTH domain
MGHEREIREFLASRRAKVNPEDVGLSAGYRARRVPGLRREEVAELAGVSIDYYIQLERGRSTGVSEAVLNAVARALLLNSAEREHLFNLTKPNRTTRKPPQRNAQKVRPSLLRLVDAMDSTVPAMIQGRRTDVLAINRLANALYLDIGTGDVEERNIARFVFLDPRSQDFYDDWNRSARDAVAMLRLASGRHDDRFLNELIGELTVRSPIFAQLWADHNVRHHTTGKKTLHHPLVGELTVTYESMQTGDSGHSLVTYTAEPGSPSADALALLASWTAGGHREEGQSMPQTHGHSLGN